MGAIAAKAGEQLTLEHADRRALLRQALDGIATPLRRVLIVPPDGTRFNSGAGELTSLLYEMLAPAVHVDVLPALGTHAPMTESEIRAMFGHTIPMDRFLVHDWRAGVVHRGDIPGDVVAQLSEGKLDYSVKIEVSRHLFDGYDRIFSVGQIVPHEVAGMANYSKNILVGAGGADIINKSHFLGAVYGMERIMGRADTPVRQLFQYGMETFLPDLPVTYVFTVMARGRDGDMQMRGLYIGEDRETYEAGARLSQKVNLTLLETPLPKVVVYLDPHEFKSTWLGNKAVYRTRMALADQGELIVLAPGLKMFGEDAEIDRLIRQYGYRGTEATLRAVRENDDLQRNLSAAAHLIHGSSEGRFTITYCPGPDVSAAEIEAVGFEAGDLTTVMKTYNPEHLQDGMNTLSSGEKVYFISNPALGLWALRRKIETAT